MNIRLWMKKWCFESSRCSQITIISLSGSCTDRTQFIPHMICCLYSKMWQVYFFWDFDLFPCVKALDVRKMLSPTEILLFSVCFYINMASLEPFPWPAGTTSELPKYRRSRLSIAVKRLNKEQSGTPRVHIVNDSLYLQNIIQYQSISSNII